MNHPLASRFLRGRRFSTPRRSSRRPISLVLESLETRQLLSTGSIGSNQIVVQPSVAANPTPLISSLYPSGLSPSEVRQAYGVNQVTFESGKIAGNGSGQTIAIIEAYNDPTISSDLKQFDREYGLPNPPSFTKYVQTGLSHTNSGWSLETALDVEWAHAMAPGANLVLVEAKSAGFTDLLNAVNFARSLNGVDVVSMSWGTSEFAGETAYDSLFTTPAGHIGGDGLPGGVTFVAASGDSGAWSGVSYPAASPNVLSVGATTLSLGANASYAGEQGWTYSTGGFSAVEPAPAYQTGAQTATGLSYGLRTQPDVVAVGNPATGLSVYDSARYQGHSGWFSVGGTSAAAPQWAGLIAVADQGLGLAGIGSLANAQGALYELPASAFHQVSAGFNGYSATNSYNLVSGLGSPIADRVVAGLLATQGAFNVLAFASPYSIAGPGTLSAQPALALTSGTAVVPPAPTAPSTIFPTPFPSVAVVVIPLGPTHVIVFIPSPPVTHSLFASNNHPVQPETPSAVSLNSSTPSTLNSFGQFATMDTLPGRTSRFASDFEVATLIDVVEPFEVPIPGAAPNKAATPSRFSPTVMHPPGSLSPLWHLDLGSGDSRSANAEPPVGGFSAAQPRDLAQDEESEAASPFPRLAFAAAVAGGGYWLALRDFHRGNMSRTAPRAERAWRPRVRRCLPVPRQSSEAISER